jgi:putative selenium metabolism protein SsnA
MLLIKNATIWTNNGDLIDPGYLVASEGNIHSVGPMSDLDNSQSFDEEIDADGNLLIPGLVNSHTHLYSFLARGMALEGVEPYSFRDILEQIWWRLDKALDSESIYYSALIGGCEMLRNGVTTLIDHHASPHSVKGSLNRVSQAIVDELGMRASLCYEISDRDGLDIAQQGIDENIDFFDAATNTSNDRLNALIGLHASFTISDGTFGKLNSALGDRAVGYHIHGAEGIEDGVDATDKYGMRTIQRLNALGILSKKTIVAHGIHLAEPEKVLLAEADAIVAHNPQSNMNNAVGVSDIEDLLDRGVTVGLGNDGFGSNMIDDMKAMYLMHKLVKEDPKAVGMDKAHQIFFQNNYAIVERLFGISVGKLIPDYKADFIILNYEAPTPLSADNMMGHLIFGLASRFDVLDSVINGKVVMRNRIIEGVDVKSVYNEAKIVAKNLWERIK